MDNIREQMTIEVKIYFSFLRLAFRPRGKKKKKIMKFSMKAQEEDIAQAKNLRPLGQEEDNFWKPNWKAQFGPGKGRWKREVFMKPNGFLEALLTYGGIWCEI